MITIALASRPTEDFPVLGVTIVAPRECPDREARLPRFFPKDHLTSVEATPDLQPLQAALKQDERWTSVGRPAWLVALWVVEI